MLDDNHLNAAGALAEMPYLKIPLLSAPLNTEPGREKPLAASTERLQPPEWPRYDAKRFARSRPAALHLKRRQEFLIIWVLPQQAARPK